MKKGISVEFNYKLDCYEIRKKKGILDLDEIQQALTEYYGSDEIFLIKIKSGAWDDGLQDVVPENSDFVEVYTLDQIKRMVT
jgi:hypothetical protein